MRSSGFRADSVIQNTAERQAAAGFTRGISTAQREEFAGKGGTCWGEKKSAASGRKGSLLPRMR